MPHEPLNYESPRVRCSKCDRPSLVAGSLSAEMPVGFYPNKYRKKLPLIGSVALNVVACAACGYVEMHVDPAKLKKLAAHGDVSAG